MELLKIIFLTVLMFFIIVTVHEWGHYYFAKRAGILVREFAIGFGPKLLSFRRGETQFTLRLLPFGGYARMAGEEPELVQIAEGQTVALRLDGDTVRKIYLDRLDSRKMLSAARCGTLICRTILQFVWMWMERWSLTPFIRRRCW
ncbi:hypothetical protein HMSSN036_36420 [Paenibacillus macerans]|nr:hypothetical protein HMSSN036_36420 [Paenibacillus macerans]